MNFQEFESQTRDATHNALDQLQAAMLLVERGDHYLLEREAMRLLLEAQVSGAGSSLKDLAVLIEQFIEEGRSQAS